jgi:indolepyruvate ferredoxin oxidoreductase
MAAHLEGLGVVTQDSAGLAQKGGATWSHVQIATRAQDLHTSKVDTAKADLVIGCDSIVAAHKATLAVMHEGRTYVALNTHSTPTASFLKNPNWQFPEDGCEAALARAVGPSAIGLFDAEEVATQLLGDSLYTNPLMLGYAWQKGRVPLSRQALLRAMELNGVQVDQNKAAFEWGRRCAQNVEEVSALYQARQVIQVLRQPSLDEVVGQRMAFLSEYQDRGYAQAYQGFVDRVRAAEAPLGSTRLALAVARNLFKLMAYKDEYEVARLHTDARFTAKIAQTFEGDYRLVHHLAPPGLSRINDRGEPVKRAFGPWVRGAFVMLAQLKRLRGTAFDVFGHTQERRTERALIQEYRQSIKELLKGLSAERMAQALEIAQLPQDIRGFGHVKAAHLDRVRPRWNGLMEQWRQGRVQVG